MTLLRYTLSVLTVPVLLSIGNAAPPQKILFNRDVRPILSDKCFACHGPDEKHRKAKLRLDVEENAKMDRDGYHVLVPKDLEKSELYLRITSKGKRGQMPPRRSLKQLTDDEIAILKRWIEQGADYQKHWALISPKRPALPVVQNEKWASNPIDLFLLRQINSGDVKPSPEADRVTLARRIYFDLTGLPPTPDVVDAFVNDASPDAYEKMVERLLASPHFGERLAIYWLDLVRYADSVGYHGDQEHNASLYRDYVIQAFNENKPFDQFTIEQLAGDLLPNPTDDQVIATAYNRLLQTSHEGGVQDLEYLAKYAADRVRNVSSVWMGATMGCAECHNHKFDDYLQEDFYSLKAFFADVQERGKFAAANSIPTQRAPEQTFLSLIDRRRIQQIDLELAMTKDQARISALKKERLAIEKQKRKVMVTRAMKPRVTRLLNRGDWMDTTGKVVTPAIPQFMGNLKTKGRATRLDLANWLTRDDHPQTSRVLVNRLWYLFFGAGISRSLDDTGSQGDWPSHPELLDWLAMELVESGWDVKHVIRLMVTSSAYRQTSVVSVNLKKIDPDNRLFARQARPRLPAEMIRDNALSVSGLIVHRIGGESARPYQPTGYYRHLNFPKRKYKADQDEGQYRRGTYVHWQRQFLHPMMRAFNAPRREECTAQRSISNTPIAALTLLNDPTFVEAARGLASRTLRESEKSDTDRLQWMWRTVLSRSPSEREQKLMLSYARLSKLSFATDPKRVQELLTVGLTPMPNDLDAVELATWTSVARALLNLNETITRN